jgi:hypothetical protein
MDPMHNTSAAIYVKRFRWVLAAPLLLLWLAAGCDSGDGLNRQPISGTVTLDGQPLATGTIHFIPSSNEAGTEVSATISGGKYWFSKSTGPVPGPFKVEISSADAPKFEPPAGKTPGEVLPPHATEKVPEKYNFKSTLTTTIKSGQSEPVDFPLTSK